MNKINFLSFVRNKNGLLKVFSANVINKIVSMLSSMVIMRIITQEEYGIWGYTLNIYSYLGLISGFGLLSGAFQFGAENRGTEREFRIYKYCLGRGFIIDLAIVCVCLLGSIVYDFAIPEAAPFIRLVAPTIVIEYIFNMFLNIMRIQQKIGEYSKILNWNTIVTAFGTCIGAIFGLYGIVIGRYVAHITSIVWITYSNRREMFEIKRATGISNVEKKELWKYSVPLQISGALNTIVYLLDVSLIATLIADSREIALYKASTLIPVALNIIPNAVVTYILPTVVANSKNRQWLTTNLKKYFWGLGCCNFVICFFLTVFAPVIILILSGREYLDAVPSFRVLILSYFVSGTFRILSANILASMRRVRYGLFVSVVSGVCNVFFDYILIIRYGMIGAAYATLLTMGIASVLSFGYLLYRIYFKWK